MLTFSTLLSLSRSLILLSPTRPSHSLSQHYTFSLTHTHTLQLTDRYRERERERKVYFWTTHSTPAASNVLFRTQKSKIHRAQNFRFGRNYNLEVIKTISFGFDLFIGRRVWDRLHQIAPRAEEKKRKIQNSFFLFLRFLKTLFWFPRLPPASSCWWCFFNFLLTQFLSLMF